MNCPRCGNYVSSVCSVCKETAFDWQSQARAAGWAPMPESNLRVEEKCPSIFCEGGMFHRTEESMEKCWTCHGTGTILRKLTPEEMVEVAERIGDMHIMLHLSSGLRVVLVPKEDK